ncbi:MAG: FHA domain-containing protein, partial [Candidatus Promineifilaceae bacterium]
MSSTQNGKLFVVEGPLTGNEFEITQSTTSLGRNVGVDIVLNATSVSRRHAQITKANDQYYIEDLGSSNGTFLNGERISGRQMLKDGDRISLGQSIILRFDAPAAEDATAIYEPGMDAYPATAVADSPATTLEPPKGAAPVSPKAQPPIAQSETQPQLLVTVGQGISQTYDLNKPQLTLGRSPDNDIVLNSNIVSRHHATLRKISGGYSLDPNPKAGNPILLHDQPLARSYTLTDGDKLVIGQTDPRTRVTLVYRGLPAEDFATQVAAPVQDDSSTQIAAPVGPPVRQAPPGDDLSGIGTQIMSPSDFQMGSSSAPPRLMVAIAGNPSQTYTLSKDRYSIGRSPDNDIVIDSKIVSRHHARLERLSDGTYQMVPSPDAGNPIHLEGRP